MPGMLLEREATGWCRSLFSGPHTGGNFIRPFERATSAHLFRGSSV